MLFFDLPITLVDDIICNASLARDLHNTCRLREVNRYFEYAVTKFIARHWLCKLSEGQAKAMPKSYRERLIAEFLGTQDRGNNRLASHFHHVIDFLVQLGFQSSPITGRPSRRSYWLAETCQALSLCNFSSSEWKPLRSPYGPPEESVDGTSAVSATSFIIAVIIDDANLQATMLREGCSPSTQCKYLGNALQMACLLGHFESATQLFQTCISDSVVGRHYTPSVRAAIKSNHIELVKLLLSPQFGINYNSSDITGTALFAAECDNKDALTRILDRWPLAGGGRNMRCWRKVARNGWDDLLPRMFATWEHMDERYYTNWDPLIDAVEGGHLSTSKLLLDHGCGSVPWSRPRDGLIIAAVRGGNPLVLDLLIRTGHIVDPPELIFTSAARLGALEIIDYALRHDYHMRFENLDALQYYALLTAIAHRQCSVAEALMQQLKLNPNAEICDYAKMRLSPFLLAVDSGCSEMVCIMRRFGASAEKCAMGTLDFSRQSCELRFSFLTRIWKAEIGVKDSWRWRYKASQREIDEALRCALANEQQMYA